MKFFVFLAFTFTLYSSLTVREITPAVLPQRIDQKQTGDYNVHLHLKDFHIIALLDNIAADTSYEYDYEVPEEYLDVTSATQNATSTTIASTITTNSPATESTTKIISSTTIEPTTEKVNASDVIIVDDQIKVEHKNMTTNFHYPVADKIPVVVIQENSGFSIEKTATPSSSNVAIISIENDESSLNNSFVTLGEILHYKKCPYGYSKDKGGRCIKNQRSQLAFNIARLASNWIRRLKYSKEGSRSRSIENICNITSSNL